VIAPDLSHGITLDADRVVDTGALEYPRSFTFI
jgi:hypothetical protein